MNVESEICRVCGDPQSKFVRTEGIYRSVIFELISEISGVTLIDDNRLPSSICCTCSQQLQLSKSIIDKLKRSNLHLLAGNSLQPFQCRSCLGPYRKTMYVNIYEKRHEKVLVDVIKEVTGNESVSLDPSTNICRPCSESLSSLITIKSAIISSNAKFMDLIADESDPLDKWDEIEEVHHDIDLVLLEEPQFDEEFEDKALEKSAKRFKCEIEDEDPQNCDFETSDSRFRSQFEDLNVLDPQNQVSKASKSQFKKFQSQIEDFDVLDPQNQVSKSSKSHFRTQFEAFDVLDPQNRVHGSPKKQIKDSKSQFRAFEVLNPQNSIEPKFEVIPTEIDPQKLTTRKPRKSKLKLKTFNCLDLTCGQIFQSQIRRNLHMRNEGHAVEKLVKRQYICYCGKVFRASLKLRDHYRLNHNAKFKCNSCGKVYFGENKCKRHLEKAHEGGHYTVTLMTKFVNKEGCEVFKCAICNIDNATIHDFKTHCDSLDHLKQAVHYWGLIETTEKRIKIVIKHNLRRKLFHKVKITPETLENNPKLLMTPKVILDNIKKEPPEVKALNFIEPKIPQLDDDFKFINDVEIYCRTCNRIMPYQMYRTHRISSYHHFFQANPQYRNEKVFRQHKVQKMSETLLLSKIRYTCSDCGVRVTANLWRHHNKLKTHQFYVQNPHLKIPHETKKVNREKLDLSEDILIKDCHEPLVPMICDYCRKKFYKKDLFEAHIKQHVVRYECDVCGVILNGPVRLRTHKKIKHQIFESFDCVECGKRYDRLVKLQVHCKTKRHLSKIGKAEKKPHKCLICDMIFANQSCYTRHYNFCHIEANEVSTQSYAIDRSKEVNCRLCSRQFITHNDLQIHYVLDHDIKDGSLELMSRRVIICPTCGRKVPRTRFKFHNEQNHPESLTCKVCDITFKGLLSYQQHKKLGHGQYMTCDICSHRINFRTQSKQILKRHMEVHLDQLNSRYVCEICAYRCSFPSRLEQHILAVHANVNKGVEVPRDETKVYCDVCHRGYVDKSGLRKHKKFMHDGAVRVPKFFCNTCGLKFYKIQKYNTHLETKKHLRKVAEGEMMKKVK